MTDYTLFVYANEKLRRIYFNHVYIIYGSYISVIFNTTEKMMRIIHEVNHYCITIISQYWCNDLDKHTLFRQIVGNWISFSLKNYFGTTFIMLKHFALLHLLALKNIQILSLSEFNAVENVSKIIVSQKLLS